MHEPRDWSMFMLSLYLYRAKRASFLFLQKVIEHWYIYYCVPSETLETKGDQISFSPSPQNSSSLLVHLWIPFASSLSQIQSRGVSTSLTLVNSLFSLPNPIPTRRRLPILSHSHFTVSPLVHPVYAPTPTQTQRLETKLFALPGYGPTNIEEKLLLEYVVSKTDRYLSTLFDEKLMDVSLFKIQYEAPFGPVLIPSQNSYVRKFKMERMMRW